ncbi:MAG TPA: YfhO family protein, partial [Sphingobacterium sp.]|nr:YfhO family protein [Sphingobacterium sp.]
SADDMGFAVFSEMYYEKGWEAYIDGEKVPIIRADYALRALQIPEGNHKIEFIFAPKSMKISSIVSLLSSILLVGLLFLYFGFGFIQKRKNLDTVESHKKGYKSK